MLIFTTKNQMLATSKYQKTQLAQISPIIQRNKQKARHLQYTHGCSRETPGKNLKEGQYEQSSLVSGYTCQV